MKTAKQRKKRSVRKAKKNRQAPKKCSAKEERFCQEYLIDLNAAKAAMRAEYSQTTAEKKAPGWVVKSRAASTKCQVWDRCRQLMRQREARTEITQDMVLEELALIGFSKLTDFIELTGGKLVMKDLTKLSSDQAACLAEISEFETEKGLRRFKFKLHDKVKTLELIGRHLAMFTDNVNNTGEIKHSGVLMTAPPMSKKEWSQFQKKVAATQKRT